MRHYQIDPNQDKGWLFGPWNSDVPVPIGYANQGVDIRHFHSQMYEIYLVAQGRSIIVVDDKEYLLQQGDVVVIEPLEVHTFANSSDDYLHFVIHSPFVPGDKVVVD